MECFLDAISRIFHVFVGRRSQKWSFFVFFAILDSVVGEEVNILSLPVHDVLEVYELKDSVFEFLKTRPFLSTFLMHNFFLRVETTDEVIGGINPQF